MTRLQMTPLNQERNEEEEKESGESRGRKRTQTDKQTNKQTINEIFLLLLRLYKSQQPVGK
jgi:hypothetical protein